MVSRSIVDDNRTNRRILEGMLARWGMNSNLHPMEEKALEALSAAHSSNHPFELILSDMHMPRMDGFSWWSRSSNDRTSAHPQS